MGDQNCFSAGNLTLIGIILSPLLGAIGLLFRELLKSKDSQIKSRDEDIVDLRQRLDLMISVGEEHIGTSQELARAVRTRGKS